MPAKFFRNFFRTFEKKFRKAKKQPPDALLLYPAFGLPTADDGDVLTGTLAANVKVSIADGATVTLDGVTIDGENYKDDDAKSYLKQNELVYPD